MLRGALGALGGNLPVAIPRVAVNSAQVIPDGAVVVGGVLVLEDVVQSLVLGKLDRPAIAVRELLVLLGVSLIGLELLVDLLVATVGSRNVAEGDLVLAGILNDGVAEGVRKRSAGQEGREGVHAGEHCR